jgi:hypothetical protein
LSQSCLPVHVRFDSKATDRPVVGLEVFVTHSGSDSFATAAFVCFLRHTNKLNARRIWRRGLPDQASTSNKADRAIPSNRAA